MDEIADAAELSKGLLYKYFRSKEELYLAVCLRALRLLRHSFQRQLRQHESGLAKISAIGRAYVAFANKHPDYFEALVYQATQEPSQEPSAYAAACEQETDKILALVSEAITVGVADGTLRADLDPMQAAMMLWGALHGLVVIATFKNIQERYQLKPDTFLRNALAFLGNCLHNNTSTPT